APDDLGATARVQLIVSERARHAERRQHVDGGAGIAVGVVLDAARGGDLEVAGNSGDSDVLRRNVHTADGKSRDSNVRVAPVLGTGGTATFQLSLHDVDGSLSHLGIL